jgi:hypothetical protein
MCDGVSVINTLLSAGVDYAAAVPILSEDRAFSSLRCNIPVAGVNSFVRMGIYDAEDMASLQLISDSGEAASDTGPAFLEIATTFTLRKNKRYLAMLCGRTTTTMATIKSGNSTGNMKSWLGSSVANVSYQYGGILYTRAYAAFPATYDGVYLAATETPPIIDGKV